MRLVDLGLREASWIFDRLLVHVELLLAELVLRSELVGSALRLVVGEARDHAEIVERLVGLRLQLVLRVVGIHLRGRGLLVHQRAFKRRLQALVVGLRSLERQLRVQQFLLQAADRPDP